MGSISECGSSSLSAPEEPTQELLEELCAKFILTAPRDAQIKDKLFFLVEQAWWYYEDKVRPVSSRNLKHYSSYTTFAEPLFRKCTALAHLRPNLQAYLEDYRRYKQSIPVYGAILLDAAMEQVLLVRGNKSSMGWGFPRGKVNEGETESDCAIREVLEETGYDIRSKLCETDYLEVTADGKRHKLYIVTGLDPNTQEFQPHCKWEIGAYAWHRVDALPSTADEASQVYMSADGVRHRFFMIHPFVARLRKWIDKRRRQMAIRQQQSNGPCSQCQVPSAGTWSVASSAASSFHVPLRELQQALASVGNTDLAPAAPATPQATMTPQVAVARTGPSSGRREPRSHRSSQSTITALQQQQDLLLQQVQQRLGQLQQAPPGLVHGNEDNGLSACAPTMSNFRFDRGSIMSCFAGVP